MTTNISSKVKLLRGKKPTSALILAHVSLAFGQIPGSNWLSYGLLYANLAYYANTVWTIRSKNKSSVVLLPQSVSENIY